eukprot:302576_1
MTLFRVTRTSAFCIGYGVTLLITMVVVRVRRRIRSKRKERVGFLDFINTKEFFSDFRNAKEKEPMRLGRFQRTTTPKGLKYAKHSRGWSVSSNMLDNSPILDSSEMGALAKLPDSKKSRRLGYWTMNGKIVLVMVGLPARGKSYIVFMLTRYLNWIGISTKVFNIGDYRRKLGYSGVGQSFFDMNNEEAVSIRAKMVELAQNDMYEWLQQENERKVALFDATNTTRERRSLLLSRAKEEKNIILLFIESICDDPAILKRNYLLKLQNNDYKDMDKDKALADFKERVKRYEAVYETIDDEEDDNQVQYIKLYNVGQKVTTHNCKGYVPSQIAFYLQNVHIGRRKIWLTRPALSISQVLGEIGEGSGEKLTEEGRQYSINIAKFINYEVENMGISGPGKDVLVLIGTQQVDSESIAHLQMYYPVASTSLLNELRGGDLDGMTRDEFRLQYPELYAQREADKLSFRFPGSGGESYLDCMQRVQPVIVELERQPLSLVVVCHLAVQRCLYAYFMGIPIKEVPYIELSQHTVVELTPTPFGTKCRQITEADMIATVM